MTTDDISLPCPGLVCWPVGIGDSTTVVVDDGVLVQIDLHNLEAADDDDDPRVAIVDRLCDLAPERAGKPYIAAFAATHLDEDHIKGFAELNERAEIGDLWFTPRIFRDNEDGNVCDDGLAFVKEAERRIDQIRKNGTVDSGDRILIVGHDDLLSEPPYSELPEECFIRPGEFFTTIDGVDYSDRFRAFVHAPFKDDGSKERNDTSLALQITLADAETTGTLMTFGDLAYPDLKNIFERSNADDLLWSVLISPHHCSKSAMYWKDEGESEETLRQDILDAMEDAADDRGAWIVACADEIPASDQPGDDPPHRKAADRYEEIVDAGRFLVTGEAAPEPLIFELGVDGLCPQAGAAASEVSATPISDATKSARGTGVTHTSATGFGLWPAR